MSEALRFQLEMVGEFEEYARAVAAGTVVSLLAQEDGETAVLQAMALLPSGRSIFLTRYFALPNLARSAQGTVALELATVLQRLSGGLLASAVAAELKGLPVPLRGQVHALWEELSPAFHEAVGALMARLLVLGRHAGGYSGSHRGGFQAPRSAP